MRTRAQRRYFTEVKKKRTFKLFKYMKSYCVIPWEADWYYFCNNCRDHWRHHNNGHPRKPTRQEVRAQDKEKAYKEYILWRTSR